MRPKTKLNRSFKLGKGELDFDSTGLIEPIPLEEARNKLEEFLRVTDENGRD